MWYDVWPLLADIHSFIQQRQPGGSIALDALRELDSARAAARSKDLDGARTAVQRARVTLKLSDPAV